MSSAKLSLRLDPWPTDYDAALPIDPEEEQAGRVDTSVEMEAGEWRPVRPEAAEPPHRTCFVDGVRRIDARVLADAGKGLVHGLFGSIGTGCVDVSGAAARFEHLRIERFLILGSGIQRRADYGSVCFGPYTIGGNTPNDVMFALQYLMRSSEAALGQQLTGEGARVFVDGPLTYFSGMREDTVGVVKTIHRPYLSGAEFAVTMTLAPGERTPLFAILDGRFDRYSCFVRLAQPRAVDHPLAGVVRIEVAAAIGINAASALADLAAALLPRFASTPARDPRAPQNLLPVGALEQELRRRLGDQLLIRRIIEQNLFAGAAA
jgi:uncharacterized protein